MKPVSTSPMVEIVIPIAMRIHAMVIPCSCANALNQREIAVHLAVACDVCGGVFLCCPFSHEMSWMRS